MHKNQITVAVECFEGNKPIKYQVYVDANNFYEALAAASKITLDKYLVQTKQSLPSFGRVEVYRGESEEEDK